MKFRKRLIGFFDFRGCHDPETLADKTFDRVAQKLDSFDTTQNSSPVSFIYGFAGNILLEYQRTAFRELSIGSDELPIATSAANEELSEKRSCQKQCIEQLSRDKCEMIVEYYSKRGLEKNAVRQKICNAHGLTMNSLHARIYRIRSELRTCVENCLGNEK